MKINIFISYARNLTSHTSEALQIYWTLTGKIYSIYKNTNQSSIRYLYDPMGNRIGKRERTAIGVTSTRYMRDAQARQCLDLLFQQDLAKPVPIFYIGSYDLATNKDSQRANFTALIRLSEHPIYGSSRLGSYQSGRIVYPRPENQGPYIYQPELKQYELSNHLGNVLATVSDIKQGVDSDVVPDGTIDFERAVVKTQQSYYPFGMLQPEMSYTLGGSKYRFGFGNHERIDEVSGSGNIVDMGDRWLDTRLGRTPKIDAKAKKYPDISPYAYAANNPIFFTDPDGKEVKAFSVASQTLVLKTLNYAFGKDHGFSFVNNTLIHNAEPPKNMTPQQTLTLNYFQETLVNSQTVTTVIANQNISVSRNSDGDMVTGGAVQDGEAKIFFYGATITWKDNGKFMAPTITSSTQDKNEILVTSGLIKNGINLSTEGGDNVFGAEHATLHEFAHGMMNVIMSEMNGEFNGVNFNDMTKSERSDWAIGFTNTLLQSQNQSLETGQGQHGRGSGDTPDKKDVAPITK